MMLVFILFVILMLAFAAIGMKLIVGSIESISASRKDSKAYKLQKEFYAKNPGSTQDDFLEWYIDWMSKGNRL